jgi:hypothetical protein
MDMKKFLTGVAAAAAFAAAGFGYVHSAKAATSNLTVDAVIVEAISLDCASTPLDFGNLDASAAAVITMSTAGARSSTVPAALVAGGSPGAGVCSIDGADGLVVDVNIPNTTITNGTDTLTVNNYTFAGTGAGTTDPNNHTVTLQAGGAQDYSIGGDLTLAGTESAGNYTGTTTVTVTYQ